MRRWRFFLITAVAAAAGALSLVEGGQTHLDVLQIPHPILVLDGDQEKWGYANNQGKEVIKPQYEAATAFFRDGNLELAAVKVRGKFGYIDVTGTFRIEPKFDAAGPFRQGRAWIRMADNFGFIDAEGRVKIEPRYQSAGNFANNLAPVQKDRRYGYIDRDGGEAIPADFELAANFSDGLAAVKVNGKLGYIAPNGKQVLAPKYDVAGPFKFGMARVKINDRYQFIDRTGQVLFRTQSASYAEIFGPDLVGVGVRDEQTEIRLTSKHGTPKEFGPIQGVLFQDNDKKFVAGWHGNETFTLSTGGAKGAPAVINKKNTGANFVAEVEFKSNTPGADLYVLKLSDWWLVGNPDAWLASNPTIPESPTQTKAKYPTGIKYHAIFVRGAQKDQKDFIPGKNALVRGNL